MGHGGTLDPLATGVLIVGIGRGTKYLQNFLTCTKTYETVVLFGKSTDTYDIAGKIVGDADFKHVTKDLVEDKLAQYRGKIRQVPPVYSALKINGMKAYEYAREGKELPKELESREMQVDECTLLEWYEAGSHDFRWPAEEAPEEEKKAVSKLMGTAEPPAAVGTKPPPDGSTKPQDDTTASEPSASLPEEIPKSPKDQNNLSASTKTALHTHDHTLNLSSTPASSPAARIRLTVSSGFYVRSFAHDLGLACASQGIMASLLRSRQAHFTVSDPPPEPDLTTTLTYADLEAGESVWGPKISTQLSKWAEANPAPEPGHVNGRDPETKQRLTGEWDERPKQRFRGGWMADNKKDRNRQQGGKWKGKWNEGGNRGKLHERAGEQSQQGKRDRVRNSSSPE